MTQATTDQTKDPLRVAFVLIPHFSMIAFSSAIEPLRIANRISDSNLFEWTLYSLDGRPVTASNGINVHVDADITALKNCDLALVCSGVHVERTPIAPVLGNTLRRLCSYGAKIGGVCTASYILAKFGLLNNYRCTLHWESIEAFREDFPEISVYCELFEIDRNRYTCAGGTASIDMMLCYITNNFGNEIAQNIAERMLHHVARQGDNPQRIGLRMRLGVSHKKLLNAVQIMENSLEQPFPCSEIAKLSGLSARQLERLFQKYLYTSPTKYYLKLRLEHARKLLRQTSMSVLQIAISSGFISASHFTKCYRENYLKTPSQERRNLEQFSSSNQISNDIIQQT